MISIGRIVHYKLSQDDAQDINSRRHDFLAYQREAKPPLSPGGRGRTGHIGHWGNAVRPGDIFPAMVVKVWPNHPDGLVNLQVYLDGNDVLWATSRAEGDEEGQWYWPVRREPQVTEGDGERSLTSQGVTIKTSTSSLADMSEADLKVLIAKIQASLLKQARRNNRTMGLPRREATEKDA